MNKHRPLELHATAVCLITFVALALTGCQSDKTVAFKPVAQETSTPEAVSSSAPEPAPATPPTQPAAPTIRIQAGAAQGFTDSAGNTWLPDQGFEGGETIERIPDLPIENTHDPAIYRNERYGMTGFSHAMPNGNYLVKLHFAETYEGISGPGQRVFSFTVEGREFKDFDVWVKAGGPQRAIIETVPAEITDGQLDITFTSNIQNPEINGIEIVPVQ